MAQLFRLNEKWPYPLMPSEYVQRQFHVSFQDDPVAVACRHITGLSTLVWGNDYPHAEGTFRGSRELHREAVRRRPRRRAQGHGRRHPRRPPGLRGPGGRPDAHGCTSSASTGASPSSPARDAASAAPTRACSPSAARASSSTTSAARWRATGADAGPAATVVAEIAAAGGVAVADTSDVSTADGRAGARRRRGRAVRTDRRPGQQRRHHALGAASPTSTADDLERPPRRARRRLVPHRPGRLAAHGRAGLRPHRHDDVDGDARAAQQHRRTPRPRAASSG